jgi:hypothetical protein
VTTKRDAADIIHDEGPAALRAAFDQSIKQQQSTTGHDKNRESLVPCTIDQTLDVFERWLILPDPTPIYAALGTIAANLLPGDPVWLGIIGPPSSAKTELLNSVAKLPYVHQAATLTPAGLLSGTAKKQRQAGARGGLLREIGEFGIITFKDFGSILSMRPDAKAEAIAALREVYDGSLTRVLGTGGGISLSWKGKVSAVRSHRCDRHALRRHRRDGRSILAHTPGSYQRRTVRLRTQTCRCSGREDAKGTGRSCQCSLRWLPRRAATHQSRGVRAH